MAYVSVFQCSRSTNNRWLGSQQPLKLVAWIVAPSTLVAERLLHHTSAYSCLKCIPGFVFPFHSPPNQPKEVSLQQCCSWENTFFVLLLARPPNAMHPNMWDSTIIVPHCRDFKLATCIISVLPLLLSLDLFCFSGSLSSETPSNILNNFSCSSSKFWQMSATLLLI